MQSSKKNIIALWEKALDGDVVVTVQGDVWKTKALTNTLYRIRKSLRDKSRKLYEAHEAGYDLTKYDSLSVSSSYDAEAETGKVYIGRKADTYIDAIIAAEFVDNL